MKKFKKDRPATSVALSQTLKGESFRTEEFYKEAGIQFIKENFQKFVEVFVVYQSLMLLTDIFTKKFEKITSMSAFIQKTNGDIEATEQEGFVFTGLGLDGVKLVNRFVFSANNTDENIIKGFIR